MKKTAFAVMASIIMGLVIALSLALFSPAVNAQSSARMERWKYKGLFIGHAASEVSKIEPDINKLGQEGWELVVAGSGHTNVLFFKRKLP